MRYRKLFNYFSPRLMSCLTVGTTLFISLACASLVVNAAPVTLNYSISQGSDDAEEQGAGVPGSAGTMNLTSTDVELVYDGGTRQVVGFRFQNINIAQGATSISNAYIQFSVDEDDSGTTNVIIYGEDADDTATFTTTSGDITSRTTTSAQELWSGIPAWSGAGTAGADQRTPDISSIISEIVQRPGWTAGNSIVIIIEPGAGCNSSACQRTAESFDGEPTQAPRLVITLDDSELGGYVGVCDSFDSGVFPGTNWSVSGPGQAALGTLIVNTPPNSLEMNEDEVFVTSTVMDTSLVTNLQFDVWINRGDDSFSENPDGGEDLEVEYFNDIGVWTLLENFPGGPDGGTFTRTYNLPADAQHANFQVRFHLLNGSGANFDYWHIDDACVTGDGGISAALAEWRMDETNWNGTTGEVIDETGSYDGTAVNGAQTDNTSPAIAGSPGTCGYGTFDGVDDYVNVPNLSDILNDTASLTFWINTTQVGNDTGWQAPGITGVEESGGGDDIFWGWLDASGNIGISVGNDFTTKSSSSINDGSWHHVVLTRDATTDDYKIYIDGSLNASGLLEDPAGSGVIGNTYSSIGRIEDTGGSPEYFDGLLDEVRVYGSVLSDAEVTQIFNDTHDCVAGIYIEANQVTLNDTTTTPTFTAVSFLQTYPTPPLVFVLPTNENTDPAAIRIRNVTTTGFEMAQVEPESQDGRSVPMTVDYIAMTEGVFTLPDGRTIEAGTHTTQTVQHGSGVPGGEGWDTVNYASTFANPSVLLQIQGFTNEYNNPPSTTSRPWLTASIQNVGNTSFETALERSEVNDGNPATINTDETIAYLAIDGDVQGSFAAQGTTILYETIVSADNIQGWDNENCAGGVGQSVPFVNTYSVTPLAIGHTRRHDGGDGGWIRRCSIDATQIGLAYDEDIFRDGERNHTTEQASVLVFSEAFCYPTCVGNVVDHYDIDFGAGSGITCLPVGVTITAKDATNATVNHTSATTISFVTSTGRGTWSSIPSAGTGTVTPGTPGNGDASYEFPNGESSVTIALNYPDLAGANSETFSINITSSPNENSGTAPGDVDPGDGTDDPTIDYFLTGIVYNNVTDGNNTIPTQISGKPSNTGFNSKTLNLQVVRATDNNPAVCSSIFGPGDVVTIEMGAECKTPNTCAGRELNISNNATPSQDIDTSDDDTVGNSVSSYEAVDLEFGANAAAEVVLTYPDAGSLQLHARYELLLDDGTPSGEYAVGISNNFVVRPFGFAIGLIQDASAIANPGAVDATGGVFVKAGEDFSFSVGAFNWGSGDDDGSSCDLVNDPGCAANDGVPDTNADLFDNNGGGTPAALTPNFAGTGAVDVSFSAVAPFAPAAGTLGTLTDSGSLGTPLATAASFSAGIATLTTVFYNEVGTMTLRASTSDYLATGQGIAGRSSNLAINPGNGSVGRFIPDRFLIVSDGNPSLLNSCDTGGFTYMDDTFSYNFVPAIEIEAVNTYGAPTVNYGDGGTAATDFFKLPTALARTYDDNTINNGATFNSTPGATVTISGDNDFADGRAVLSLTNAPGARDAFMFERDSVDIGAGEGAPFTASIDVLIRVTAGSLYDPDSSGAREVCYDGDADGNCEFDGSDDYAALTDTGGSALPLTEMRFGRLNIGTAVGSELLPLAVPFQTEYFDGSNFIINTDDVCTSIAPTDLVLDSAVEAAETDGNIDISNAPSCASGLATATVANDPFVNGSGELSFSLATPAAGCTGYIDITTDLSVLALDWLRYDWNDDDGSEDGPYDDDPTGRAEFGLYKGPDVYIYIR